MNQTTRSTKEINKLSSITLFYSQLTFVRLNETLALYITCIVGGLVSQLLHQQLYICGVFYFRYNNIPSAVSLPTIEVLMLKYKN